MSSYNIRELKTKILVARIINQRFLKRKQMVKNEEEKRPRARVILMSVVFSKYYYNLLTWKYIVIIITF